MRDPLPDDGNERYTFRPCVMQAGWNQVTRDWKLFLHHNPYDYKNYEDSELTEC